MVRGMKYYLFVIKKEYYKKNDFYLYSMLENLKLMNRDDYSYGVGIYQSLCSFFNKPVLRNYIEQKYDLKCLNDIYYLNDNESSFKINKSYCWIKTNRHLRELLCLFYVYHKNIFVCNFENQEYFWLQDKMISKYV